MKFDLNNYPKFIECYKHDRARTWAESLQAVGYKSATNATMLGIGIEMNDVEFTHFVLVWS